MPGRDGSSANLAGPGFRYIRRLVPVGHRAAVTAGNQGGAGDLPPLPRDLRCRSGIAGPEAMAGQAVDMVAEQVRDDVGDLGWVRTGASTSMHTALTVMPRSRGSTADLVSARWVRSDIDAGLRGWQLRRPRPQDLTEPTELGRPEEPTRIFPGMAHRLKSLASSLAQPPWRRQ